MAMDTEMDTKARVLAIDDDLLLIRSVRRILREHHVSSATCVTEAITRLRENTSYDLILCDLSLPDGSGAELNAKVAHLWPGLERKVVFVTGGPRSEADQRFLEQPGIRWVRKPFSMEQLRDLADDSVRDRD